MSKCDFVPDLASSVLRSPSQSFALLFVFSPAFLLPIESDVVTRNILRGLYAQCFRVLIRYLLVERWCVSLLALSETQSASFVCSRSPRKSERAISSCALLFSACLFCNFAPPLPPVFLSWHGRVRALQAARSFPCILWWAPFNPISEIHSDAEKEERNQMFYFASLSVSCQFHWK